MHCNLVRKNIKPLVFVSPIRWFISTLLDMPFSDIAIIREIAGREVIHIKTVFNTTRVRFNNEVDFQSEKT